MQNLLASDEDRNRPTRRDYYRILAAALARLDENTAAARRAVYERARTMLAEQVRGMDPPLPPSLIARHRLALEHAIQQHEIEEMSLLPTPALRRSETFAALAPAPTPTASDIKIPQPASDLDSRQERALANLRNMVDLPPEPIYERPRASVRPGANEQADQGGPALDQELSAPDQELPSIQHVAAAAAAQRSGRTWVGLLRKAVLLTSVVAGLVVIGNWQADNISAWLDGVVIRTDGLIERLAQSQFDLVDTAKAVPGEADRVLATAASDPLPASALGAIAVADSSAAPVVLFEAGPDMTGTKPLSGSVSWRSETIVSPLWLGPERAVRAEIDIPGKGTVTVLVRRNFDQGFLASHAIVIVPSFGSEGVGINEIPGVLMKRSGEPRGSPLRGVPMTAEGGQFQILLSAAAADIESNERMLRERPVLGIPIIYNDGRRSLLTIEKGEQGDRAFEEAFAQWGSATPIEPPDLLRLAPWNFPTGNPPATTERLRDPSGTKKGDGNRRNPCGPNAGPCGVHPPAPTKLMTQIGAAAPTNPRRPPLPGG